jgi:sialate O-acetylesterase
LNPPAKDIYLSAGTDTISLAGNWKYNEKLEPKVPTIQNYQYFPSFLYNGMLAPVIPYTIKGAIWYQGEANDSLAYNYRELFPLMINDWRIRWQQGNFPFLYVQLPNYRKRLDAPAESQWAELREAQSMAQLLPNTGMACAIDLGLADNIHPLNKQDVGMRLAQVALNKVYVGSNDAQLSPQIASYRIKKDTVYVTIDQKQLKTTDGQLVRGFAVAGEDRKFYFAEAEIKNNLIKIHCKQVKHPIAVRYAWADNPDCNVVNANGLPLVPFRSDQWKGITQK